jgi:archaellum component FlaC
MYRRVNSGGFIGAMTLGIVIVMEVFTWVMWGMSRQVYVMTDVMVELNGSFKSMVIDMSGMTENMVAMRDSMERMDATMSTLSTDIGAMNTSMEGITSNMGEMTAMMGGMTRSMQAMTVSIGQMTNDVGRASYAFSNPMSYMFGGGPFPF